MLENNLTPFSLSAFSGIIIKLEPKEELCFPDPQMSEESAMISGIQSGEELALRYLCGQPLPSGSHLRNLYKYSCNDSQNCLPYKSPILSVRANAICGKDLRVRS